MVRVAVIVFLLGVIGWMLVGMVMRVREEERGANRAMVRNAEVARQRREAESATADQNSLDKQPRTD